jgi:hypothetical protein
VTVALAHIPLVFFIMKPELSEPIDAWLLSWKTISMGDKSVDSNAMVYFVPIASPVKPRFKSLVSPLAVVCHEACGIVVLAIGLPVGIPFPSTR